MPWGSAIAAKAVTATANGLERLTARRPVDLLPEIAHVHVYDVGAVDVLVVPGTLQQLKAIEDLRGSASSSTIRTRMTEPSSRKMRVR